MRLKDAQFDRHSNIREITENVDCFPFGSVLTRTNPPDSLRGEKKFKGNYACKFESKINYVFF